MARLSKQYGNTQHETKIRQKVVQEDGSVVYKEKDAITEIIMKRAMDARKKSDIEKAQKLYSQGNVQRKEQEAKAQQLADMADAPFARMADDETLDRELKSVIHVDDPMAAYFQKKEKKEKKKKEKKEKKDKKKSKKKGSGSDDRRDNRSSSSSGADMKKKTMQKKPIYKGPWVPPNRFGILPGYRWDGIDRGNKFEDRLLKKINETQSSKDIEHRWSTQDM